jgi:hypothetical protein
MIWLPFRRALRNPIFRGGVVELARHRVRWSHGLNYLMVLAIVLFITWPKENFLSLRDLPFTYNALGVSMIIILSYLSFSYGSRKSLGLRQLSLRDWLSLAPLKAGAFLRGYLAVGLLELLFFWGLSLPLLVLAAGVSGESLSHFAAGLLVIVVCTSCYRVIGIVLLTLFERDEFLLYIMVRLLYVFFILVSGFVLPLWNPVLAFADTSIWPQHLVSLQLAGLRLHGWLATVGLHLLIGGAGFIIACVCGCWIQRRAASSVADERGAEGV